MVQNNIEYTIRVTSIKTEKDTNTVKELGWLMLAEQDNIKMTTNYGTAVPDSVLGTLDTLTEQAAIAWLEANDSRIPEIKTFMAAQVLKRLADQELVSNTPSWIVQ